MDKILQVVPEEESREGTDEPSFWELTASCFARSCQAVVAMALFAVVRESLYHTSIRSGVRRPGNAIMLYYCIDHRIGGCPAT